MAVIKDARVQTLRGEAESALLAGRKVFVCRVNQSLTQGSCAGPLDAVAEQIEAVEEAGWRLDHSTFAHDNRGHTSAFLIFRR